MAVTNEMPWFHAAEDQGCQPDGGTSEEVSGGEQVVQQESISVYLMHGDGITVPRHSPEMDETDYDWLRSTPSGDPKRAATMEYNQVT